MRPRVITGKLVQFLNLWPRRELLSNILYAVFRQKFRGFLLAYKDQPAVPTPPDRVDLVQIKNGRYQDQASLTLSR